MNSVESVKCFSVNFSSSLDIKGNFQALTLLDLGDMPYNMQSAFAFFRGHLNVFTLSICALHGPIFDLKLSG